MDKLAPHAQLLVIPVQATLFAKIAKVAMVFRIIYATRALLEPI